MEISKNKENEEEGIKEEEPEKDEFEDKEIKTKLELIFDKKFSPTETMLCYCKGQIYISYDNFSGFDFTGFEGILCIIINRVFSIKYPEQSQFFNKLSINKAQVIRYWGFFITKKEGYGKVPYFVYTKGAKKTEEKKDTYNISKELKTEYCKRYKLSLRDYDDLYLLYKDEFINDVLKYEKLTSIKEQEKNFIKQK